MLQHPIVLCGLGNPGSQYLLNRHNIGHALVDALATFFSKNYRSFGKDFLYTEILVAGKRCFLCKPMGYMNRSGESLLPFLTFHKLSGSHVLVIHDDIDLDFMEMRVKRGGGHGGHNGLRNLDLHIKNDYFRFRLGVGRPVLKPQVSSYVLSNFDEKEQERLGDFFLVFCQQFPLLFQLSAVEWLKKVKDAFCC